MSEYNEQAPYDNEPSKEQLEQALTALIALRVSPLDLYAFAFAKDEATMNAEFAVEAKQEDAGRDLTDAEIEAAIAGSSARDSLCDLIDTDDLLSVGSDVYDRAAEIAYRLKL